MSDRIADAARSSQVHAPHLKVRLLDDQPVDADGFGGHQRVARAIAELITKEDGGKAIALEGSWGSGKSSVVRMLGREVDHEDTTLLVFDAWSHEGDPLRRVFLEDLTSICCDKFDDKTKDKWGNRKKSEITGRVREIHQTVTPVLSSKWPILVLAGATLYPVALVSLGGLLRYDSNWWILTLTVVAALVALGPTIWLLWLFSNCNNQTKAQLERAGQLISLWSKKTDETTITTAHEALGPTSIEFQAYFSDIVTEYLTNSSRRLVIVLDNLDRVPESTARTLWSTLRLFADSCENSNGSWSKRIWFIVPYDRASAANLWETQGEPGDDHTGDEDQKPGQIAVKPASIAAAFLDKAFQIRFGVPPLHIADWEKYLKDDLLKTAMPGIGSDEERHRVYRLSERLSDEKGRPPSPRHLKLYINDIGALVRQFSERFPLDHLALYALLRRQDEDIRLWVRSGKFKRDPLARVMPDETFIESLLAIYFGTDDPGRAKTLTLSAPLRSALRNGDGEQLKQLALVPGFWSVAQVELERELESEDTKQEVIVNLTAAIETSELNGAAPPEYSNVIPVFSTNILKRVEWVQLNDESAKAAGTLLRLAKNAEMTKATFARLVSGEGEEPAQPSVGADAKAWASGAAQLVETARSLGHAREMSIPGDASQVVKCLAAIGGVEFPEDVLQSLRCNCPPAELVKELAPTTAEEWPQEHAAALRLLLSAPQIKVNWKELVTAISARLQADIGPPECIRLLEAMVDLHDCSPKETSAAVGSLVQDASYYVHVNAHRKNAKAIAWLLTALIFGNQVLRAPGSDSDNKGYEFLQTLFRDADETNEIADELLSIVIARPRLALLDRIVDQHDKLDALGTKILTTFAQREDSGKVLHAASFIGKFGVLSKVLGDQISLLATNALRSGSFRGQLKKLNLKIEDAAAHCALAEANALIDDGYRNKLFGNLAGIEKDDWRNEIQDPAGLSKLLVFAIDKGFAVSPNVADAFQDLGQLLCGDKPPEVKWTDKPSELDKIYSSIDQHHRSTASDRIVDQLLNQDMPASLPFAVALFGNDLTKAFAKRNHESLVRRIADPIVKSGDRSLMRWLVTVIQCDNTFWNAAPEANRSTFANTLWQQLNDEEGDPENKKLLQQIADLLGIRKSEPQDDAPDGGPGV